MNHDTRARLDEFIEDFQLSCGSADLIVASVLAEDFSPACAAAARLGSVDACRRLDSLPGRSARPSGEASPDPQLAAWLRDGKPPVYFGLGSMPVRDPSEMLGIIESVARERGERAVVVVGWSRLEAAKTCPIIYASWAPSTMAGFFRNVVGLCIMAAPALCSPPLPRACRRWFARSSPTSHSGAHAALGHTI